MRCEHGKFTKGELEMLRGCVGDNPVKEQPPPLPPKQIAIGVVILPLSCHRDWVSTEHDVGDLWRTRSTVFI